MGAWRDSIKADELAVHNYNALAQAMVTVDMIKKSHSYNSGMAVFSRGSSLGQGKVAQTAHIMEDLTYDTFERDLISGAQTLSLLGLNMVGSYTCGHQAVTDLEVCLKWAKASSLLPVSVDYHDSRDLASIVGSDAHADTVENAKMFKYALLRYTKTLL